MRFESIVILVVLIAGGCATQSHDDVIERVARSVEMSQVEGLATHQRHIFPDWGIQMGSSLPPNAPPAQVAREALKNDPEHNLRSLVEGHPVGYGSTKVLRVRRIRILSPEYERAWPGSDPFFTAVLMDTSIGRVVVLLQYKVLDGTAYWAHWTIDPDGLLNEPPGANSRHAGRERSGSSGVAAVAQAERSV